ncbi:threonine--tRNA ligase [Candidatus Micrarchaeota archaeon]|nr:threonine--tRNA ligase [Candidatus Micrarchaeota archaeon]MBU1886416.1 threonine--tRNA ligase [Candidatus Micrarchaeota archaeon]
MRILAVHADFIEVEQMKKAIKDAEEVDQSKAKERYEEVLVVFTAVEEGDKDVQAVASSLAKEAAAIAEQVKTKTILLYPLVHLTSKPSAPRVAYKVLLKGEELLKKDGYHASHSPFGWYKGYTLKCKGHPLSELSREISSAVSQEDLGLEKTKKAAFETTAHLIYENARKLLKKEFISISTAESGFGYLNWWNMKSLSHDDVKKAVANANDLIKKGELIRVTFTNRDGALKVCGQFYNAALPQKADHIRIVSIGDLPPEPCKNKHIPNIDLIKSIKLEDIRQEGENLKIKYSIEVSQELESGDQEISASLKQEDTLKTKFYIMDFDGNLHDVDKFNYKGYENLKKFATYETKKVRAYEKEPPHIKIMKEHALINYEPGSDPGNFRFLPKGRLMKALLERAITDICTKAGGMEVETPIMYDYEHPSLKKYLNRFPARQYVVLSEDKKLFLRFAACFGQFLIAHDMVMTYKQLPLKMYELTRYSFRREQSGELAGLKRLRAFTMPDMHTFSANLDQAKTELKKHFKLGMKWLEDLGLDAELGFRAQEDFFNENKQWYIDLMKMNGKPMLLEMFKERYAYFITKFEFNFVDSMDKASALTTDQIDVENAETYDITYVDADGSKKRPYIQHASISGSLERVIYAILEKEAMRMAKGEKAIFPLWLSPTQIRVVPIGEKHKDYAKKVLEQLDARNVRVDLDERDEPLGKKIRDAQKEWIPYIVVIGDKEMESGKLNVTIRATDTKEDMPADTLAELVENQIGDKPFMKLSLPKELSKRPIM